MTVVVDTNVHYEWAHERATDHGTVRAALDEILAGQHGRTVVTDYIVDETFTLIRHRTRSIDVAYDAVARMLGLGDHPSMYDLEPVGTDLFDRSFDVLRRYRDHDLSFTDATTVALMEARGIDHVLSFDDGFDGVVDRLDPADVAAGEA